MAWVGGQLVQPALDPRLDWQTLQTETLYASLIVISALGIVMNLALQFATRRLLPWQVHHGAH